jgi:uncharacterized protein
MRRRRMAKTPHIPDVYLRHLARVTGASDEPWKEIWTEDGSVEFPYAANIGRPTRLNGLEEIDAYFVHLGLFSEFQFTDWKASASADRDEFVVEMRGLSTLLATDEPYEQQYIVRFGLSSDGRLAWMREYWDPTRF